MNKLNWVDSIKAVCMIAVYLLHSEMYYGTAGVSYGYTVQPFYVNAFFFVSGYLFFRKYLNLEISTNANLGGVLARFKKRILPLSNSYTSVLNDNIYT